MGNATQQQQQSNDRRATSGSGRTDSSASSRMGAASGSGRGGGGGGLIGVSNDDAARAADLVNSEYGQSTCVSFLCSDVLLIDDASCVLLLLLSCEKFERQSQGLLNVSLSLSLSLSLFCLFRRLPCASFCLCDCLVAQ
jgi:hypothetical protein